MSSRVAREKDGLRTPNEAFYIEIPMGLGKQTGQINSGAFSDIFGHTISTHFGTVSPLSMYSIIQPLFLQKTKPLSTSQIFVWDLDLNLGCKELGI